MENKFQWGRMDEVLMFVFALGFLVVLVLMHMPAEAIMAMSGSLMTIVPIYIKSALERKNWNGDGGDVKLFPNGLPLITESPPIPPVEPQIHYLRESE